MGTRAAGRIDGPGAAPRLRTTIGGAIVLLLVAGAAAVLSFALNAPGGSRAIGGTAPAETSVESPGPEGENGPRILVHVLGAVAQPGLYELDDGERIVDAVAAAGGFASDADQAALNLARVVGDGEQVYVPVVGEEPPQAPAGANGADGLVDLNAADATALETLPGLGPELARRIVEWRTQNGRFSRVEDLLNVTGIGEKTLSGLADLVTT